MKTKIVILFVSILSPFILKAQQSDTSSNQWSLNDCIEYALKQNIDVRGSELTNKSNQVYLEQAKWQKSPTVSASVDKGFSWANSENSSGNNSFSGSNSTSYSVSSSLTLYNGLKLNNQIKQAQIDFESGKYNSETIKESVSLSVLEAFLQVLYAEEEVNNSQKQVESTTEQLQLAEERLNVGVISRSDYLQVKSELASEKLTFAEAQSTYEIAKVELMQLMELPVSNDFEVVRPDLQDELNELRTPNSTEVYQLALGIKPQIKNAELSKESAEYDEKIARASYYPSLSMSAGVGTGYSNLDSDLGYFSQLNDEINPSVGLSLSIPIFQQKQVKTNVQLAQISIENAELNQIDVQNELRKNIEQACVDVNSAQIKYDASKDQYDATEESYNLAEQKFEHGLINSVDFLVEKTNLIVAESDLLQAKYNLIFSYKILDFYEGKTITL